MTHCSPRSSRPFNSLEASSASYVPSTKFHPVVRSTHSTGFELYECKVAHCSDIDGLEVFEHLHQCQNLRWREVSLTNPFDVIFVGAYIISMKSSRSKGYLLGLSRPRYSLRDILGASLLAMRRR